MHNLIILLLPPLLFSLTTPGYTQSKIVLPDEDTITVEILGMNEGHVTYYKLDDGERITRMRDMSELREIIYPQEPTKGGWFDFALELYARVGVSMLGMQGEIEDLFTDNGFGAESASVGTSGATPIAWQIGLEKRLGNNWGIGINLDQANLGNTEGNNGNIIVEYDYNTLSTTALVSGHLFSNRLHLQAGPTFSRVKLEQRVSGEPIYDPQRELQFGFTAGVSGSVVETENLFLRLTALYQYINDMETEPVNVEKTFIPATEIDPSNLFLGLTLGVKVQ